MSESLKGDVRVQEPSALDRAVGRRAAETRATVPQLELSAEVSFERALTVARENACEPFAVVVRACALALRAVPRANAAYRDGRFELYSRVNVGVLVMALETHVSATVLDADNKGVRELSEELSSLTARAHAGELSAAEQSGATFTLIDAGALGVSALSPLIAPPQAAAAATGAVRESAPGMGAAVLTLTLACDHRILYGAQAAKLLLTIKERLEEGAS